MRENVLVEDEREASAGVAGFGGAVDALSFRRFVGVGFCCGFEPAAYGCDRGEGCAPGGHLAQEKYAAGGEEHICQPDTDSHGKLVLSGESRSGRRQEVVDEDQGDGEDESCALAAAPGGESEGNADEHEDEAGGGIGEALMQLDEIPAAALAVGSLDKLAVGHGQDGRIAARGACVLRRGQRKGQVGLGEGGDVVLVGLIGDGFVLGSVAQPHDGVLISAIDDGGGLSGSDLGRSRVGEIGEEDLTPVRSARSGADILNVEDVILEVFVEDARLDLEGSLRVEQLGFEAEGGLGSLRARGRGCWRGR